MATTSSAPFTIDATPAVGQNVTHNGKEYTTVKEGLAYILVPVESAAVPQTAPRGETQPQSVFYNPIQQFNRDLSVLAIKAFGEASIESKLASRDQRKLLKGDKRGRKRKLEEINKTTSSAENESQKVAKSAHDAAASDGSKGTAVGETGAMEGVQSSSATKFPEENSKEDDKSVPGTSKAEPTPHNDTAPSASKEVFEDTSTTTDGNATVERDTTKPSNPPPPPPSFTILDALSATGLRALRYAQEIPFATSVTANDLLAAATESIKLNIEHNKMTSRIKPITGNALTHMYSLAVEEFDSRGKPKQQNQKYDVIDLDPYGTAAPFLDAAVQSVRDGGLLCITCTDAGVWASNGYPEKAYSLYGGIPMKGVHSHEAGLRLILHAVAAAAARYGLAIEPLLSLSIDFYARVFVKVKKSAAEVKFLAGKTMVVYNCDYGCGAWTTQLLARNKLVENKKANGQYYKHVFAMAPNANPNCDHCGMKTHMAGPMWAGPIHTPAFVQKILDMLPEVSKDTYQTTKRIEGMLSMALEETIPPRENDKGFVSPTAAKEGENDPAAFDEFPFFFIPSAISKVIHCVTPHENALRGAIRNLGYRVTRSHTKAGSIKTDAPWSVIWEIMREWVEQKAPVRDGAVREGTAGWKIMGLDKKKAQHGIQRTGANGEVLEERKIVFDEKLGEEKDRKKLVRYQLNPRENWGPMTRARGS